MKHPEFYQLCDDIRLGDAEAGAKARAELEKGGATVSVSKIGDVEAVFGGVTRQFHAPGQVAPTPPVLQKAKK